MTYNTIKNKKYFFSLRFNILTKNSSMSTDIERFKNACENGDLETVADLFDVVNGHVDMLRMRNIVTKKGHLNIIKFLHKKGVDINELCDDENPLLIAAKKGWVDIVDYLLSCVKQDELDMNIQDSYGWTPLMFAVIHGQTDVVDRLLQIKECKINISNNLGNTAIFLAAENECLEIVDKLIVYGSDIGHINKLDQTLVHIAATSENPKVLERLLSFGLDINQQDNNGWTPLIVCVRINNKEGVKILLEHGADTTIKNNVGKKASYYAHNDKIKNLLKTQY